MGQDTNLELEHAPIPLQSAAGENVKGSTGSSKNVTQQIAQVSNAMQTAFRKLLFISDVIL